ncbi:MAG: cyclic nucleotide-binding domain-containing protein [Oscillospiraceae bacterium]|nr:cyclic nucleotide-binding domain-containing protein [Oscillospiraceae bacterium]
MATSFKEGSVIFREGDPLEHISLIAEGEVECLSHGHTSLLGKTDVLGFCDLKQGVYTHTYTALTDVSMYQYPCKTVDGLNALMSENADIAYLMVGSLGRQITELLYYRTRLKHEAENAFELVNDLYSEYSRLCKTYASTPKKLPGLEELKAFAGTQSVDDWVHDFYTEISELATNIHKAFFHNHPGIEAGFLNRCIDDISAVSKSCAEYQDYLKTVSALLLDSGGYDLFSLVGQLHTDSMRIDGADFAIEALMAPLTEALSNLADMSAINAGYYQERLEAYWDSLENKRDASAGEPTLDAPPKEQAVNQNLLNSLDEILKYAGVDDEISNAFTKNIHDYTELEDRNSSDDPVPDLRRDITKQFYVIYRSVFLKTLEDAAPPTIIKMFLNFGYVDPALAGYDNANFLYSIADTYKGDPENNIFTVSEWLTSIYKGVRDPSLSEFDMDFTTYCRDLKNQKQIDANEEKRLLADRNEHLKYEMENAFPVVNRVTFGNPSRFCPVYSSHNILRDPETTLITAAKIREIIEEVRTIDFSAFYRETRFSDQKAGITDETISVEIIPNFILMPNVGLRGSMWQEIEGRLRTTPARIFMPIFLEGDLKPIVIRLIGDFRWEMCRRVQGSRWNDLTDPSLTSYFCDYLQFYMNNRSIAMQTMTEIRNELGAARNNYKTVFVQNYVMWIINESKGMARLNSIALGILMTFCPFNAQIREQLSKNMRYNEALTRFGAKRQKRAQRLNLIIKKLQSSGKTIPKEIMDEFEYAKR